MNKNIQLDDKPTIFAVFGGKIRGLNRKYAIYTIALTMLVFIMVPILGIEGYHIHKGKTKIDAAKADTLVTTGDCSASAQQSIANEQPNTQQVHASIALLNYRALCLEKNGKYQEANKLLEQVKSYYQMNHLTQYITQVDEQITANNGVSK